jgi:hypothetical protein
MSSQTVYRQMATLLPVDRDEIIANVKSRLPEHEGPSRSIELARVRTYLQSEQTLVTSSTFTGVVVPAFATHWGVVVDCILYHLIFRDERDVESNVGGFIHEGPPIKFHLGRVGGKVVESTVVGKTKYSLPELIKIGDDLIEAFGSYHRLFWNYQVFMECFLSLITDGATFGQYNITYSI